MSSASGGSPQTHIRPLALDPTDGLPSPRPPSSPPSETNFRLRPFKSESLFCFRPREYQSLVQLM